MNQKRILKIHPDDTVVVALKSIISGSVIDADGLSIQISKDIPTGHKIAIKNMYKGDSVIKYGMPIGTATQDVRSGDHVHVHNLKTRLTGEETYAYHPEPFQQNENKFTLSFQGYKRSDGSVGIRNEIWIIPTVGCVNKIAEELARKTVVPEGIDGIHAFAHPYGCSQLGGDHEMTQKILAGLVHHPNGAGVLVLGLGCENNTMDSFQKVLGDVNPGRVKFLITQDVDDEIEAGLAEIQKLISFAISQKREALPVSELVVGLKCGGSDGFSGITANPLVGVFSDILIENGGSSVLTEVPEMFGAESILMNRAVNSEVFKKTVGLVQNFKEYFLKYNQPVYENPSPGNKDGGISTLEEKSVGCTQKGGLSPVVDVLDYGEPVKSKGLNLLNGPGNDMVAVTALAASGCHLILFTTGRGTPLGGPVPTVKISSNSDLAQRKSRWIDFDAGSIVEGMSIQSLSKELFENVIQVADGQKTRNELNGYREIAIFKDGVTL